MSSFPPVLKTVHVEDYSNDLILGISYFYELLNILENYKERMLYTRRDRVYSLPVNVVGIWSSHVFLQKTVTQFCHHVIQFFDEVYVKGKKKRDTSN
jgi:hypothetical protein